MIRDLESQILKLLDMSEQDRLTKRQWELRLKFNDDDNMDEWLKKVTIISKIIELQNLNAKHKQKRN